MLAFKRFFTSEAGPSKPDPAGTAIRLIRNLLERHERLSTPQIWEKGTEGFKPILQPVQEYNENGDIKMKIVSNMREGRRVWVPPPVLPMPHHPFQSVNFLKKTLLAHLESRGAIHKALGFRPAETEEERKEAERKALRMTRRRERIAAKSGGEQPPPIEPDYRVAEYAWQLGPRLYNPDIVGESSQDIEPTETIDEAFRRAEQFELAFHENRLNEEEMIRKRKEVRYEQYRKLREQVKEEKEEDVRVGRVEDIHREAERLQAIDRIYQYAQETGEDVSEWFAELGVDTKDGFGQMEGRRLDGMMGDLNPLVPSKSARGRASGTFEEQQYRRARESLLSRPSSIEFDDEVDISTGQGDDKPFGLQRRAKDQAHDEDQIPSPRSFNNAGRDPKPWKQRFGFDKDPSLQRQSSTSERKSGFEHDLTSERQPPRSSKGFGFASRGKGDEKPSSSRSGRGFGFTNSAGSEKRSSSPKGFGLR